MAIQRMEHVDELVLHDLVRRQRDVELHTGTRVLDGLRERGVAHADELGGERDRGDVRDPPPHRGLVAGRPDGHGRRGG